MSNCTELIHNIQRLTRNKLWNIDIYIDIDPYVSRPIETIDNEESMFIYLCARVVDTSQCIVTSRRICLCMFFYS